MVKEIGNPQLSEKKSGLILRNFSSGTLAKLSQIIFWYVLKNPKIGETIFGMLGGTHFNWWNMFQQNEQI